jgi:FkbM family methyltransferase
MRRSEVDEISIVLKVLASDIGPAFTMIDVGGHFGSSSLRFAERGAKIVAFEPDAANRDRLHQTLDEFPNAVIDARAVSDADGQQLPWYRSPESTGISGLSAFRDTHVQHAVVETVTLGTYCQTHAIDHIDFLKIDTEGYDLMVLQGHNWCEDRSRPRVIVCEFEDAKTLPLGYCWNDLAELLRHQGYELLVSEWHPIVRYGIQHRWRCFHEYPCALADARAWGNLVAFREHQEYLTGLRASRQLAKEMTGLVSQSRQLVKRIRGRLAESLRRVASIPNSSTNSENKIQGT